MSFGYTIAGEPFDDFLVSAGQNASMGNARFVARNFLLDQGVDPTRQGSYRAAGVMVRHADFSAWEDRHVNAYLVAQVWLEKLDRAPGVIDQNDHAKCPETFRLPAAFQLFGPADDRLDLIRVVDAEPIAKREAARLDEVLALAQHVVQRNLPKWTGTTTIGPPPDKETEELEAMLEQWDRTVNLSPVWATFWEDIKTVFGNKPADDPLDWPDKLRDWAGLCHFDPASRRREVPLFVFRYSVGELPRLKNKGDLRPLAVPTVLDGRFSEAFCPSPKGQPGYMVALGGDSDVLRREVLHPAFPFRARDLFRTGVVKRPVPVDLTAARRKHLENLRYTMSVDYFTYAEETDSDLWPALKPTGTTS